MIYHTQEYKQGDRVAFIPLHANNDINHRDVKQGTLDHNDHINAYIRFDGEVSLTPISMDMIQKIHDDENTSTR